MSPYTMSYLTSRHVTLRRVMLRLIMSCHVLSCLVTSRHFMSCFVVSCHITTYQVMSCHVKCSTRFSRHLTSCFFRISRSFPHFTDWYHSRRHVHSGHICSISFPSSSFRLHHTVSDRAGHGKLNQTETRLKSQPRPRRRMNNFAIHTINAYHGIQMQAAHCKAQETCSKCDLGHFGCAGL